MKVWTEARSEVTLHERQLVGQGGQGAVYAQGATAYKIYHDPMLAIPEGKLRELSRIRHPQVLRPEATLRDRAGQVVGYAMPYFSRAYVLGQLFPRAFRQRHRLEAPTMAKLVEQLRELVEAVHRVDALVVDLNEMNCLVAEDFSRLFLIDVDSYQTPHYPAAALMDSIRDRHSDAFSELTDWFSFAVLSFQLFAGIHPYRGQHPQVAGLEARMQQHLSVFRPEVKVPRSAYPLEEIPEPHRGWLERVLDRGERSTPPTGAPLFVRRTASAPPSSTKTAGLKAVKLAELEGSIDGVWASRGQLVISTTEGLWLDGRKVIDRVKTLGVGFTAREGRPVAICDRGSKSLVDLLSGDSVGYDLRDGTAVSSGERLYVARHEEIVELSLLETTRGIVASSRVAARVLPHAARLHPGVAIQRLGRATYATMFPGTGRAEQRHLRELDGYRVLGARFEPHVLVVVAEQEGRCDRLVFRFLAKGSDYDLRVVSDIGTGSPSFVVLDTGVAVLLAETDELEVFHSQPGPNRPKRIDDPLIGGDMLLARRDGELLFARKNCLYQLTMS